MMTLKPRWPKIHSPNTLHTLAAATEEKDDEQQKKERKERKKSLAKRVILSTSVPTWGMQSYIGGVGI